LHTLIIVRPIRSRTHFPDGVLVLEVATQTVTRAREVNLHQQAFARLCTLAVRRAQAKLWLDMLLLYRLLGVSLEATPQAWLAVNAPARTYVLLMNITLHLAAL
jgi:hypothetical protein